MRARDTMHFRGALGDQLRVSVDPDEDGELYVGFEDGGEAFLPLSEVRRLRNLLNKVLGERWSARRPKEGAEIAS